MTNLSLLTTTGFNIPANDEAHGAAVFVKNKRRADMTDGDAAHTIMMMHGATFSSESLFDVPLEGESFMDFLALAGFDVWAVDVRGYGRASRPPEMALSPAGHAPLVRTETAVHDFALAVDFVLQHRGVDQVNIIGMSWGGSVTGAYTARHAHNVRRLGLIAPQWLSDRPVPLDTGGPLHAWRSVSLPAFTDRWVSAAPEDRRAGLVPAQGLEAWIDTTLAAEPDAQLRQQQSIGATNGAVQDIREYWTAGRPFYQPGEITVPVMLLHGEWDRDVPLALARDYFAALTGSPDKRWLEIGAATHMMVLETPRKILYRALTQFFSE